jgi:hypothetical protein
MFQGSTNANRDDNVSESALLHLNGEHVNGEAGGGLLEVDGSEAIDPGEQPELKRSNQFKFKLTETNKDLTLKVNRKICFTLHNKLNYH